MRAFRPRKPVVIGLLGGIGSGKSTVARMFAEAGLVPVDADEEAHRAVEDPAILTRIRDRFGPDVLGRDGRLDRAALARLVFADDRARRDLEAITHPPVRAAVLARVDAALREGRSVVLDVPLLLERGLIERCDATVFVDASDAQRRARVAARGWTAAELRRREAAQVPLDVKKARATASIVNEASPEHAREQVAAFLARLLSERSGDG